MKVAIVGDGISDALAPYAGGCRHRYEQRDRYRDRIGQHHRAWSGLGLILVAQEISRRSCRKMLQNAAVAFGFNGIGIPVAATGLIYPERAMTATTISVTAIFLNSLWVRPGYSSTPF